MQAYPVIAQSKQGISTTTGSIPKGLYRHDPSEWRIKKIQEAYDGVFHLNKAQN